MSNGTITVTQNYAHLCEARSGSNGLHDLMYSAGVESGQSWNRGALCSLNASGNLIKGCSDSAMPLFAKTASADFDVAGERGTFVDAGPACFVGTGSFELYTTEYVTTDSYAPNTKLWPGTGNDSGKVQAADANYNDGNVVGCVSEGVAADPSYGQSVLYFWTMFIPKIAMT